ncbi:MAG: YgiQ family radical SAM protein [Lachnospiraceae bacterium]|nr:YgiQ family radical SAM protein [Lachnospiraceae bacterium]
MDKFLPVNQTELKDRGWDAVDFTYVCGDAYVDHPSFGMAIISRLLEAHGYRVGIIAQPDWKDPASIDVFGEPRLGFLVSSGNMDSMVNHYTVAKKHRSTDAYTPGGQIGKRPDRAVTVYCNLIRQTYKKTPIIIGGIEASLRRLGHYDYWSDSVRRSILLESGADLISYGMGEHSIIEIADALAGGIDVSDITYIDGTVFKTRNEDLIADAEKIPSYEEICADKMKYAEAFRIQYHNTDPFTAHRIAQGYGGKMYVVQNPPAKPLSTMELDDVYALPYTRAYHPSYEKDGGIAALSEIKYSLTSNRGCFGECNFCALTMHEGRIVQARSHESILEEAKEMITEPDFKGYIHDVGGPTAEFRAPACAKQLTKGACTGKRCLYPKPCPNLKVDHSDYVNLLRKLRKLPNVKKVFVRSGFRFDYLMADPNKEFLKELCEYHVSGQLRVAPEHISDNVLKRMGKPSVETYNAFIKEFERVNKQLGKDQYIVPYLMSSHPGSTLEDAIALAEYLRDHHISPDQVQDFYPTPGTVSTTMYYTGIDPLSGEQVYVAHNPHEKAMQRALIQYRKAENHALVKEALIKAGREDLIGFGPLCLIPPRPMEKHTGRKAGSAAPARDKAGGAKPAHNKAGNVTPARSKAGGKGAAKAASSQGGEHYGRNRSQKQGKTRNERRSGRSQKR